MQYKKKPKKNCNNVPAYLVSEIDGNDELESFGNVVESALCSYDIKNGRGIKDSEAIRIIELLIDKYYFNDSQETTDSQIVKDGAHYLDDVINNDLRGVDNEVIVKILGVIRFVARRRTKIGPEYMHVIHQYVGQRVAPGIRALSR